ncbi:MAG TPA: DUF3568 family protein [Sedimentisphaerales bacterium]|nr:DUF3568 family protein [Sedimentisphaerales bacterium]
MKRIVMAAMLAAVSAAASGCVVAAVGAATAGTVVYVRGEIESYFDSDVQTLYNATVKTVNDLNLLVIEQSHDALSARVIARNSEDQKITISIDGSRRAAVKVTIRVGFWGDEAQSRIILARIQANTRH